MTADIRAYILLFSRYNFSLRTKKTNKREMFVCLRLLMRKGKKSLTCFSHRNRKNPKVGLKNWIQNKGKSECKISTTKGKEYEKNTGIKKRMAFCLEQDREEHGEGKRERERKRDGEMVSSRTKCCHCSVTDKSWQCERKWKERWPKKEKRKIRK